MKGEEKRPGFPGLRLLVTFAVPVFALLACRWLLHGGGLYCVFREVTGLYCPGCGGQRAVKALLGGNLLSSLYYHPVILPAALYLTFYLLSQSVNRLTKGKTRALCFKSWHLYVLLGLLLLQWIVKNVLHLLELYTI